MKITATKLWALGLSAAFAPAQAACGDRHVDPIVEVHLATTVEVPTEGPWAPCIPPEDGNFGRMQCPDREPDGAERTCRAAYVAEKQDDGSNWCDLAAQCNYECETAEDCPRPPSGTATPVCNSVCELPCDANTTCPSGMECWHMFHGPGLRDEQGFCMWKYQCD
ncbi:hypothetical protein WME95_20675 [Sorangium sp. So ce327]|jgi:hypothetical protein|uniref:hypothetical protein n=1 Tax=Sorangium sp. So ce327 TaxID=3133301 RepID=UPI003F5DF568